jgi:hypothetical protein
MSLPFEMVLAPGVRPYSQEPNGLDRTAPPQTASILAVSPCARLERAVTDVKPFQIWDVRENEKAPWREAKVINVRRDAVELQFLDVPQRSSGRPDL